MFIIFSFDFFYYFKSGGVKPNTNAKWCLLRPSSLMSVKAIPSKNQNAKDHKFTAKLMFKKESYF